MNSAIYIDADNVSYKCMEDILDKAKNYNIISKKIYADWTQDNMKKWGEKAKKHGFEGIQCFGNNFKQTSDIYMITDIINDMYSNQYLECIILATSDIDFTRLCQIIKVNNKKLIIFTPQQSSLANMSENSSMLSSKRRKIEYEFDDDTIESEGNYEEIDRLELLKLPFENCNVYNISKYKKILKNIMKNYNITYKFDINHVDIELKKFPKYFKIVKKKGAYKILAIYKKEIKNLLINSSVNEILSYYST